MNVLGCAKSKSEMLRYGAHSHHNYEIIYTLSGRAVARIGGREYAIEKNDILILPPGTVHQAESEVFFTDFFLQAKFMQFEGVHLVKDKNDTVLSLMNMVHDLMLEQEGNDKQIADSLLETICGYLTKYLNARCKYPFVNALKNVIMDSFTDPYFDLAGAIGNTGYHKDYFRRCFEEEIGKTPLEYLTGLRINRAKMLLVRGEFEGVRATAESCGFSDSFYFSSVFKKNTGLSPLQYRKKHTD